MTDSTIIAASYAAERNYSHNPDDVIDPSGAVLAIGTEKVDTTTLKDRSLNNNDATIHGAMRASGYFDGGRRFVAASENYLDCGDDNSLSFYLMDSFTISFLINANNNNNNRLVTRGPHYATVSESGGKGDIYFKVDFGTGTDAIINTNEQIDYNKVNYVECIFNKNNDNKCIVFINGVQATGSVDITGVGTKTDDSLSNTWLGTSGTTIWFDGILYSCLILNTFKNESDFNTLARLPFWSVNYTDYPDNVAEYTNNLPYSSSIINSGTFKVDSDKLQCVSAGTMTYSASYEFDGSEYIKVEIGGVEYAGTGTITQGNTTVSVAQGSNKVTIAMGTGDAIDEINIQFRAEV